MKEKLRRIIEKAFDSKAEAYSYSELAKYFKRRELIPTLIHQRVHHIIKGRKGTGKTAILLYLSLPVQVYCTERLGEDFVGFYLTFGSNLAPQISFDPGVDSEIGVLFGHWFNLYACKVFSDSIVNARKGFSQTVSLEQERLFAKDLWNSFLGIEIFPTSLEDASLQLDVFQKELRRLLSSPRLERINSVAEYMAKRINYTGRLTNIIDFPEIVNILKQTLSPLSNKLVLLLMDEYDNLSWGQQSVVNTAIAGSTGQYYASVGVFSEQGLKTRNTITGLTLRDDQFKVVDLENFGSIQEYEQFVRASIEARLTEIQKGLSEVDEMTDLFIDLDKLIPYKNPSKQAEEQGVAVIQRGTSAQLSLPNIDTKSADASDLYRKGFDIADVDAWWTLLKQERQPTYCGLVMISLLSSGLIRTAIEIVYRILKEGFANNWDIIKQAKCIPYDVQDSAIRQEADYWFRTKLLADIKGRTWDGKEPLAEVASRLIKNLLKRFSGGFMNPPNECALNCFSIRELKDGDADGVKALKEGGISGIFTELDDSCISAKDGAVFAIHPIYSVRNNLPPIRSGCFRLSWDKFQEYCRPPRGVVGAKKDTETQYFFGVGFREIWENKVRDALQKNSPPGYKYSNGAGAHEASILVVGTVEKRVDAARLCIFDVTNQNENVLFEYGLAVARRKPIRHLLNQAKTKIRHPNQLIPLLRGINLEMYSFSDDPSEEELLSLKKAVENAVEWYERYRRRGSKACSLNDKCRFIASTPLSDQVFIVAPEGSMAGHCLPELHELVRGQLNMQVYPTITNVKTHYICGFCQAAGRSKYCIVDTTNCDPTFCGVLGLAFGYGRKVLNIYEKNRTGLITNFAGQAPREYTNKEHLIFEIRRFLQDSEVGEYGGI